VQGHKDKPGPWYCGKQLRKKFFEKRLKGGEETDDVGTSKRLEKRQKPALPLTRLNENMPRSFFRKRVGCRQ